MTNPATQTRTPLSIERDLYTAQQKAQALFAQVVDAGLIRAGKLESELSAEIHRLARARHGLRRHWHKRIVRSGPNSMLTYHDAPPDRRLTEDDIVYLDFGPVFEEWEADFGRTYVLGTDPIKQRLITDIGAAFQRGKELYERTPELSCGELYDFVAGLATAGGWEFGAATAGHLIGQFPHERAPGDQKRFSIRHGNPQRLREPDARGLPRHWILEIHFIDRAREIGAFCEELLTI
jgi:Xaa-Pro aminopeptidase